MRLGWDEIARRAKAFSEKHAGSSDERADAQLFVNDFFKLFGLSSRQIGRYERRVADVAFKQRGFIDFFWPGQIIVEMKSRGKDLRKAEQQALDYIDGVHPTERPRFVLACDFQSWRLVDLEEKRELTFPLADLYKHVEAFSFIQGRRVSFERQEAVTIKAAELMGRIHDALKANGYTGHDLERYLVRLLFCMFADDTGIFQPKDIFLQLIENDTAPDGSNVGRVINELFEVLDTPEDKRQANLSGELKQFPYVNGRLFAENLRTPVFDKKMREDLLDACRHDWAAVSPAIFGSLFQSVMDAKERRAKGAHYTSESNILKVIGPLFLDHLRAELDTLKARKTAKDKLLLEFQARLARMTFLDPACGCGNFLVIAYRELRKLELEWLQELYRDQTIDAALLSRVTVDQFYGIEYEEFPAMIAEVAMWMTDHIANNAINEAFRLNYARIPLTGGATIRHGDALEIDWSEVLPAERCSFVMGNPPFVGAKFQTAEQRAQVRRIAALGGSGGTLDYVAAWFLKAGQYLQANKRIRIAFVSTNSITQGEQVAQLWPLLFDRYGLEIAFAHRTFNWFSEARGKAHVHVVIVGLTHRDFEPAEKRLFSYPDIKRDPVESRHGALTAYLFDAKGVADQHLIAVETTRPLSARPSIVFGNMPNDGGNLILSAEERALLLGEFPDAALVRPLLGAKDFLDGNHRYCLWLPDVAPEAMRKIAPVVERVRLNREYRAKSSRQATRKLVDFPTLFGEIRHTAEPFILIPRHSSERRDIVPLGFFGSENIAHDSCLFMPNATHFDFGILTSRAHMAWLSQIGGRFKSDFRYSIGLVYNTFPWPEATPAQRETIEELAQAVLDARAAHPTSSLADLYDPDTMPANLRKAHHALDLAVDRLYRRAPFESDRDRVEHLFGLYENLVNPLSGAERANKRIARKANRTPN